jgi:two-component system phosphate regulon sensor histidine kinase PhoR
MILTTALAVLTMVISATLAIFLLSDAQAQARVNRQLYDKARRELEDLRRASSQREELAALGGQVRALGAILPVGVITLAADERILLSNARAFQLLGVADAPGVTALGDLSTSQEMLTSVRQVIVQRRAASGVISPSPGIFVEVTAQPLDNGDTAVLLQDVSELRHLRTVRRDFVANVSHELRTPLAAIRLLVDTLEAGALEEPAVAASFVHRIGVEVEQLIQMVSELLELSRIESGQAPPRRERISVAEVIQNSVDRLSVVAADKGITVKLLLSPDLQPALADRDQIGQVLMNLLYNAIKFTPPGGKIEILASSYDGHVTVAVRDTGMGIPREDITRIFERFYKLDKSRNRSGGGTGLGLPIARHIVESHGGSIWAESEEGNGSTFTFTLPAAE